MKNKIAFALISSVAVAISSVANIKPAQAQAKEIDLGGLNLAEYCNLKYPVVRPTKAIPGNGAYSWVCRMPLTQWWDWPYKDFGLDMQDVCRQQKRNSMAYARPTNERDAGSWRCFIKK
jgi:hypothetical protein